MLPSRIEAQALPPPPGVIGSLRAGFDAITSHIGLILMPLGLDLLLWLGPRLSVNKLMQPVLQEMSRLGPTAGLSASDIGAVLTMYRELLQKFSLLGTLRTLPVGVPSLMSGRMPAVSPLGGPAVLQIASLGELVGLLLLLTIVGWTLGALYFNWMAGLVTAGSSGEPRPTAGRAVTQTIIYSLICAAIVWTVGFPALILVYLTFVINSLLGQGLFLVLGFFLLWLLVPFFFSPHGMYVRRQNAFASFLGGFQLTRLTLPSSSLFVLTVFLVGVGLNMLWAVPAEDSWLTMVGILGHAFVTTALLASSFIYYQDMSVWLQRMLERLRSSVPGQPS